jgi:hypothetical protein
MLSARLSFALAAVAATAAPLAAEPGRPEGTIDLGGSRVEVLSREIPVGKRIELPEGWFRVEEEGDEDRGVGSFTVVKVSDEDQPSSDEAAPAGALARPAPAAQPALALASAPGPSAAVASDPCRAERSAYLKELWHMSGIEVDDPEALIDGLSGGSRDPSAGFYWFALATDPFRPLAGSSELRDRARALVACVQARSR